MLMLVSLRYQLRLSFQQIFSPLWVWRCLFTFLIASLWSRKRLGYIFLAFGRNPQQGHFFTNILLIQIKMEIGEHKLPKKTFNLSCRWSVDATLLRFPWLWFKIIVVIIITSSHHNRHHYLMIIIKRFSHSHCPAPGLPTCPHLKLFSPWLHGDSLCF